MSEPITRADYAKWLLSCGDLEMHAMFEDWCAHNPAESASPPRVPGPSAQFAKVGVQSGPGQPIDLAAQLENDASAWEEAALAADEYDHAPEGMRETAALEREAAAEIRRLRAESANNYRAGIEAAAQVAHVEIEKFSALHSIHPAQVRTAIRALADKPAPDPLLPGLSASVGDDGCWLHFRTTDGNRSASFHIANKFNDHSFMDKTVRQWCSEREAARKGG